jgi:hypothetical protein
MIDRRKFLFGSAAAMGALLAPPAWAETGFPSRRWANISSCLPASATTKSIFRWCLCYPRDTTVLVNLPRLSRQSMEVVSSLDDGLNLSYTLEIP